MDAVVNLETEHTHTHKYTRTRALIFMARRCFVTFCCWVLMDASNKFALFSHFVNWEYSVACTRQLGTKDSILYIFFF